jgi:predicted Zn-dependent protease with MMP-like domain
LNGTIVSINEFPTRALSLYQTANLTGPNRAINTLGMARSNLQSGNTNAAVNLYKMLLIQMNSSNDSDPIFLQEALNITIIHNSATTNKPFILSFIFIFCIFYN